MGVLKLVTVIVALVAIAIGTVKQVKPELFLKVPHVGYILHAITGGSMPPYFSPDAWEPAEMRTWIKDGDLVVATGTKCGTTWMLWCAHQIRTKGSDVEFGDVSYATPWPDLIQRPGGTWAEQKPLYNTTVLADGTKLKDYWDRPEFPFRVWKTHYTPKVLPLEQFPKVKFLAMSRNGLDVINSMIPFFDSHSDACRTTWGGFPPKGTGNRQKDAETRMNELMPGGLLGMVYWDYVLEWWPMRNAPNVLFLHYADAVKDLKGTVAKLAAFVGVQLTDSEHAKIVEKCGMTHMKSVQHKFRYMLPLNPEFNAKNLSMVLEGAMTRQGGLKTGERTFTDEQKARWIAAEEKMFTDPAMLKWAREGGAFQ